MAFDGALSSKLPSMSVTEPPVEPFTLTVAPISGSPPWSITCPLTVMVSEDWATAAIAGEGHNAIPPPMRLAASIIVNSCFCIIFEIKVIDIVC